MVAQSKYLQTLIKDVMDNSDSNDWDSAVTEWEISDVEEDELLEEGIFSAVELRFCKHTTFIAEDGNTYIVEQ